MIMIMGGIFVGDLNEILHLNLLGVTECNRESNQQHQIQIHSVGGTRACSNTVVFNRPPCRAVLPKLRQPVVPGYL